MTYEEIPYPEYPRLSCGSFFCCLQPQVLAAWDAENRYQVALYQQQVAELMAEIKEGFHARQTISPQYCRFYGVSADRPIDDFQRLGKPWRELRSQRGKWVPDLRLKAGRELSQRIYRLFWLVEFIPGLPKRIPASGYGPDLEQMQDLSGKSTWWATYARSAEELKACPEYDPAICKVGSAIGYWTARSLI